MKISQIKPLLKAGQITGTSVKIMGDAGIGKTEVVKQYAKENNNHIEVLMLSCQEIGDLIGIPTTINRHGQIITEWSKPSWLQKLELAAFPLVSNLDDLLFNDKEFERFVLDRYTPEMSDLK